MTGPRVRALVFGAALVGCHQGSAPAPAEQPGMITGQVFIATRGGETFRLSLVDIYLMDETSATRALQTRATETRQRIDTLQPQYDRAKLTAGAAKVKADRSYGAYQEGIADHLSNSAVLTLMGTWQDADDAARSAERRYAEVGAKLRDACTIANYFPDLSLATPIAKTTTDADGRFSLKVRRGENYILAASASRQVLISTEHYFWSIRVVANEPVLNVALTNRNIMEANPADGVVKVTPCAL